MTGYQVVRVWDQGEWCHPVQAPDGRFLKHADLRALAEVPCSSSGVRTVRFILADESTPNRGQGRMKVQGLRYPISGLSLWFGETGLSIGTVEDVTLHRPGVIPETEGFSLTGIARLSQTLLAAIAWEALTGGVFGGVCIGIGEAEQDTAGWIVGGTIIGVCLGPLESVCLRNARVLCLWEGRDPRGKRERFNRKQNCLTTFNERGDNMIKPDPD